jgi:hypothetical protein
MTKPLAFTEASVRRTIAAVRKAGLEVSAVSVTPDGTVTVYQAVAAPPASGQNHANSKWLDVEA